MPNIIPPPAFGGPITKMLKVSINNAGDLAVSNYALVDDAWTQVSLHEATLEKGRLNMEIGVNPSYRGMLYTAEADWTEDYPGSQTNFLGQYDASRPTGPFVYANPDLPSGQRMDVFAAPAVIYTISKVSGKRAVLLRSQSAVHSGSKLETLPDRESRITITQKSTSLAVALWLEKNHTGFIRFSKWPEDGKKLEVAM